jgi:ubiquinone/menaquinone biosynthesis C-methylase UbiE
MKLLLKSNKRIMNYSVFAHQRRILERIFRYYRFNGQEFLLDIGCGEGWFSQLLSKYAGLVLGVDIIFDQNWRKIKSRNIQFVIADACNLPFRNECLDIVFEKDALHHIKNHEKALKEIARVTRKGGTVILIEANRYNPILYFHMTLMKHHEHFTKKYVENLIASAFRKCHFTSIESHVYPIRSKIALKIIHILEDLLGKIPFFKDYLSYNISIVKNGIE